MRFIIHEKVIFNLIGLFYMGEDKSYVNLVIFLLWAQSSCFWARSYRQATLTSILCFILISIYFIIYANILI